MPHQRDRAAGAGGELIRLTTKPPRTSGGMGESRLTAGTPTERRRNGNQLRWTVKFLAFLSCQLTTAGRSPRICRRAPAIRRTLLFKNTDIFSLYDLSAFKGCRHLLASEFGRL